MCRARISVQRFSFSNSESRTDWTKIIYFWIFWYIFLLLTLNYTQRFFFPADIINLPIFFLLWSVFFLPNIFAVYAWNKQVVFLFKLKCFKRQKEGNKNKNWKPFWIRCCFMTITIILVDFILTLRTLERKGWTRIM